MVVLFGIGVEPYIDVYKRQVLDYAKEPIIGANVILKGTSRGVITDVKGEFTLDNVKMCIRDSIG